MNKELSIRILFADAINISEAWKSQNNCSSFWRLYLNSDTGASVYCDGREYEIPAERFFLIPAWARFSCRNIANIGHFYIHFELMGISGNLTRRYFPAPVKLKSGCSHNDIASFFRKNARNNTLLCQTRIKQLTYSCLSELFESLPSENIHELQRSIQGHLRFSDLLEYIDSNLISSLENHDLARKSHMSLGHFVRTFTPALGQSPAKYVQERRIAEASKLLSFTDMSIDEISEKCGFSNRFHFSRIFRKIMALPPAAYRLQKNGI